MHEAGMRGARWVDWGCEYA